MIEAEYMNNLEKNTTGNIWRKWDLHVHTPKAIFNNQFGGDNETVWDKFVSEIEQSDIEVIGATDYYSIAGYKKLKKYKNEGRLENVKMILPNIEFRLTTGASGNRFVNYHVLFSPSVSDECIENSFLKKLTFELNGKLYSCERKDLEDLGKKLSDGKDNNFYRVGCQQFKVDLNQLMDLLTKNDDFNEKYFTVVAGSRKDGVTALLEDLKQGTGVYSNILNKSDGLFDTNDKTVSYFLGNTADKRAELSLLGGRKPCFEGSDVHKLNDSFGKRWTWIKAEPTFDGLLQTKFEPERRIRLSKKNKFNPDLHDKSKTIQSIQIRDTEDRFQTEVKFNPGLNAIIGGKSSGKSILLYEIAKGIIKDDEIKEITRDELNYNSLKIESNVTLSNGEEANENVSIQYFPQLYINKLSECFEDKRLQNIIKDCLKAKNTKILDKVNKFDKEKSIAIEKIGEMVKQYCQISGENSQLCEKKRQIGNPVYLDQEINDLNKKFEILTSELKLSSEEMEKYNSVNIKISNINDAIQEQQNKIVHLKDQYKEIDKFSNDVKEAFNSISSNSKELIKEVMSNFNEDIVNKKIYMKKLVEEENSNIDNLNGKVKSLKDSIESINKRLNRKEELDTNRKRLEEYQSQKVELKSLNQKIEENEANLHNKKEGIKDLIYQTIRDAKEIEEELDGELITNDLKLKLRLSFSKKQYAIMIDQFIDGRKQSRLESVGLKDPDTTFFIENNFADKWDKIINNGLDGKYDELLKKNCERKDFILSLAKIPVDLPININKENDDLDKMSPGKRALVILELLLENNANNPILIDQPEDNLDNRSISKDLVQLLRRVSIKKQIIIVTHNANLVVLSDADEVIVANQDPELKENQKYRFEYITGSLENARGFSDDKNKLCSHGIRQDVTDILEGGVEAFKIREKKYLI